MTVPSMVAEEVLYTDVPDSQYCTLLAPIPYPLGPTVGS
jgi:hypothetical protein